jgi:putative phage regulatory protein
MLSNKIEQLRKEKGYTFAKLSELSGISTGRLSDLASGKRNNPTMDTLIKLADALDVTLDELVGRKKNGIFLNPDDYIKKNEINKSIVIGTFESKK